jgi:HlyD family secretion protein
VKAVALAASLVACGAAARSRQTTAVVTSGEVAPRVLLTGELHPAAATDIVAPQTDQTQLVIRWLVPTGTRVHAGDRVAELDSTPFQNQLQELTSGLASSELALRAQNRTDQLAIATQRNSVRRAQIERDKAALHAAVPADVQDVRTARQNDLALARSETELAIAKQDLAALIEATAVNAKLRAFDVERTRRTMQATQQTIASLVLRSPRDGLAVVAPQPWADRPLRVGDTVVANAPLVSLPDFGHAMEVAATLSDVDDGRVSVGEAATCTLDAFPDAAMPCAVDTVSPFARVAPGRSTLRRSFDVTLKLDVPADAAARLRAGMSFEVELRDPPVRGLVLPRAAVVRGEAGAWVVMASGEVRDVEIASCDEQRCALSRGLTDGELVQLTGGRS